MKLMSFAKLTPEERDTAWAKMDKNRRNALVGEVMGYRVVAHSWPCRDYADGPSPDFILPITYYHHLGVELRWPVYVPEDLTDADWPPSWKEDEEGRRRRCDLEALPDFVGDMGAAYEIVKWLRVKYEERGKGLMRFMIGIKNQHPSRSWWYLIRWWFLTADWPEVLGRAVVEAVIARQEVPG